MQCGLCRQNADFLVANKRTRKIHVRCGSDSIRGHGDLKHYRLNYDRKGNLIGMDDETIARYTQETLDYHLEVDNFAPTSSLVERVGDGSSKQRSARASR